MFWARRDRLLVFFAIWGVRLMAIGSIEERWRGCRSSSAAADFHEGLVMCWACLRSLAAHCRRHLFQFIVPLVLALARFAEGPEPRDPIRRLHVRVVARRRAISLGASSPYAYDALRNRSSCWAADARAKMAGHPVDPACFPILG